MTRAAQISPAQTRLDFEAAEAAAAAGEALVLELDGYEGPLHVLLALARTQKVDLRSISILTLAEQYLAFVRTAERRRFAVAADYLVMASWLAYLKSRLLLPAGERPKAQEAPPEAVAAALALRLQRLDAMRRAAEALETLPKLGRDVWGRGDPQAITVLPSERLEGDLHALMRAYVEQRRRSVARRYRPRVTEALPLDEARQRLRAMALSLTDWTPLTRVTPQPPRAGADGEGEGPSAASCLASTFAAGLELVKDGALEARQAQAFADLYLRRLSADRRSPAEAAEAPRRAAA